MTENAIQIENLTKAYPKFKLQNLNLTLPTGCILGLIGENGAGKSTTIRLLLKLLERDSGKVELLGTDIDTPEFISRRNDIGVVLDEVGFPAQLNARQLDRIFSDTYARWDSERFFRPASAIRCSGRQAVSIVFPGHENESGYRVGFGTRRKAVDFRRGDQRFGPRRA